MIEMRFVLDYCFVYLVFIVEIMNCVMSVLGRSWLVVRDCV